MRLSQFPQLFPCLDKLLDGLGAGHRRRLLQAAFPVGFTIEIPDVLGAQEGEPLLELLELFFGEDMVFLQVKAPSHNGGILAWRIKHEADKIKES